MANGVLSSAGKPFVSGSIALPPSCRLHSQGTVLSFASLSLEPLLVSIGLIEGNRILHGIRQSGRLAINLLAHDQSEIALHFAGRGADRFQGVSWVWNDGLPYPNGVASYAECFIESDIPQEAKRVS